MSYRTVIIALELPRTSNPESLVRVARSCVGPELSLLVPTNKGRIVDFIVRYHDDDANVYASLDLGAHESVANVASSDSLSDRLKMFYHESLACTDRSPIEWLECYRGIPVFVNGFDLAVDDCHRMGEVSFKDYGQCYRFNETIYSGWWERHRASLASRQLFSYSLGLGWSFSAWKLYGDDDDDDDDDDRRVGSKIIDSPSRLLCLRDVVEAGLMPSSLVGDGRNGGAAACLNGPVDDFAMGDATFSPTGSPPPECGYGWWNASTLKCDYWIPPPPTPAPTIVAAPLDYTVFAMGAVIGACATLFLNWVARKMTGGRADGYSPLP